MLAVEGISSFPILIPFIQQGLRCGVLAHGLPSGAKSSGRGYRGVEDSVLVRGNETCGSSVLRFSQAFTVVLVHETY